MQPRQVVVKPPVWAHLYLTHLILTYLSHMSSMSRFFALDFLSDITAESINGNNHEGDSKEQEPHLFPVTPGDIHG